MMQIPHLTAICARMLSWMRGGSLGHMIACNSLHEICQVRTLPPFVYLLCSVNQMGTSQHQLLSRVYIISHALLLLYLGELR